MNNKQLVAAIRRFGIGRNQILVEFKRAVESIGSRKIEPPKIQALDDAELALAKISDNELFAQPLAEVPQLAYELTKEAVRRGTPKDGLLALGDAKLYIGTNKNIAIAHSSGAGTGPARAVTPLWLTPQLGLLERAAQDVRLLQLALEAKQSEPSVDKQIRAVISETVAKAVSTERQRAAADGPQTDAEKQRQMEQQRLLATKFGQDALIKLADARPTTARHELEFFIGCGGERWDPKEPVGERPAGYHRVRHWLRDMTKCGLADGDGKIGYRIAPDGARLAAELQRQQTDQRCGIERRRG